MADLAKSWPMVTGAADFLSNLVAVRDAAHGARCDPALLFVYVSWKGCTACMGDTDFHDELKVVPSYEGMPSGSRFIEVPWFVALRIATMQPEDEHDVLELPESRLWTRTLTPDAYKTLFEMTSRCKQALGAGRPVETYPQPPENRPHFPQLFVFSGKRLAAAHPPSNSHLDDLFEDVEDWLTRGYFFSPSMQPDDVTTLRTALSKAVLVQLVNENLFKEPDVDFVKTEFRATVGCIIEHERKGTSATKDCVAYWRPGSKPESVGADVSTGVQA